MTDVGSSIFVVVCATLIVLGFAAVIQDITARAEGCPRGVMVKTIDGWACLDAEVVR